MNAYVRILLGLLSFAWLSTAYAETNDEYPHSVVILLFILLALTVSTAFMHILSLSRFEHVAIPYTVVVFLLGVVFSFLTTVRDLGAFGDSLNQWVNLDADLLLYIFFPALAFGEAMHLKWHHVKGNQVKNYRILDRESLRFACFRWTRAVTAFSWTWCALGSLDFRILHSVYGST